MNLIVGLIVVIVAIVLIVKLSSRKARATLSAAYAAHALPLCCSNPVHDCGRQTNCKAAEDTDLQDRIGVVRDTYPGRQFPDGPVERRRHTKPQSITKTVRALDAVDRAERTRRPLASIGKPGDPNHTTLYDDGSISHSHTPAHVPLADDTPRYVTPSTPPKHTPSYDDGGSWGSSGHDSGSSDSGGSCGGDGGGGGD